MSKLDDFKAKYPDIYKAIYDEAEAVGFQKGETAGIEKGIVQGQEAAMVAGADAERLRIQSVEKQLIPGHEELIETLKFDGKTTGEQAAVQILQAEKAIRVAAASHLKDDSIPPTAHVQVPDDDAPKEKTFEQLVADHQAENNCRRGKSISAIAKAYPDKHAQYLTTINKGDK